MKFANLIQTQIKRRTFLPKITSPCPLNQRPPNQTEAPKSKRKTLSLPRRRLRETNFKTLQFVYRLDFTLESPFSNQSHSPCNGVIDCGKNTIQGLQRRRQTEIYRESKREREREAEERECEEASKGSFFLSVN